MRVEKGCVRGRGQADAKAKLGEGKERDCSRGRRKGRAGKEAISRGEEKQGKDNDDAEDKMVKPGWWRWWWHGSTLCMRRVVR